MISAQKFAEWSKYCEHREMGKSNSRTYLPALKGRVGKWAFYTTLMKFTEVNERIRLSREIYQNKNLSDMVQRTIDRGRAKAIAEYLKSEEERFFPAMVVAVFEGAPNWLEFSISTKSAYTDFDSSLLDLAKLDSFGFLELTGKEKLFPLDGQHRLAGIQKALSDLQSTESHIPDDEITVMLVAHEPNDAGRIRSRRLFTVLNKRAVPVKKHETIALDEDDVMAIATRHLVEEFAPFTQSDVVSYRPNANIPIYDNNTFTTIITLYDTMQAIFLALSRRKLNELRFNRPSDPWLSVYLDAAKAYFVLLFKYFPEVKRCLISHQPSDIISKNRNNEGGHILFRPVGQKVLSQLVASYVQTVWTCGFEHPKQEPQLVTKQAISCLTKAFEQFEDLPTDLMERPYAELIWMPDTGRMSIGRASIVRDIILKRYDLIRPAVARGLSERIRRSVGGNSRVEDFLWK